MIGHDQELGSIVPGTANLQLGIVGHAARTKQPLEASDERPESLHLGMPFEDHLQFHAKRESVGVAEMRGHMAGASVTRRPRRVAKVVAVDRIRTGLAGSGSGVSRDGYAVPPERR